MVGACTIAIAIAMVCLVHEGASTASSALSALLATLFPHPSKNTKRFLACFTQPILKQFFVVI